MRGDEIALSRDRFDGTFAELTADVGDMHVDGLREHQLVAPAPYVLDDVRAILHDALVAQEEFQQGELFWQNIKVFAVFANSVRDWI